MALAPNRPPIGVAFETPPLEDVAFEPNKPRDKGLDVSLLGDTIWGSEKIPSVDGDLVIPSKVLLGESCKDALLLEGAKFEPNRLPPRDSVFF